jgi:hypothetical protein
MLSFFQVEKPHVRELIDAGLVVVLPASFSQAAERILLDSYPLHARQTVGVIDWSQIPNATVCNWMATDDDRVLEWARRTTAAEHANAILLYNSAEPCLIGRFDDVIPNLDVLIWGAPGVHFVFGADGPAANPEISRDLIEYNGIDKLTAQKSNNSATHFS